MQTLSDNRAKELPKKNTRRRDLENCHPYKTKDFSQPDLEDPSESEFEEKAASRGPVEVCKEGRGIGAQSNNQKVKKKKIISSL